ncbi:MAG: tRNA (cytidine(56)-2'-O)-methyltransferase [Euryarchaeota archaeon]|nr:tRNA (cytidine(56)-2'-O)-methyltransferase [Euryarchaeota archaeon]
MITVLRMGHRPQRDKRITTHVALVARAFGADSILISTEDKHVEASVRDVVSRFGGDFSIESGVSWRHVLRSFEGVKVHLTMYGLPVDEVMPRIPRDRDMLVVVGAEKVPREVYDTVDFNIAVGNQPHSEVAALAIFLDRYFNGEELKKDFHGKWKVVPQERGKKVVRMD